MTFPLRRPAICCHVLALFAFALSAATTWAISFESRMTFIAPAQGNVPAVVRADLFHREEVRPFDVEVSLRAVWPQGETPPFPLPRVRSMQLQLPTGLIFTQTGSRTLTGTFGSLASDWSVVLQFRVEATNVPLLPDDWAVELSATTDLGPVNDSLGGHFISIGQPSISVAGLVNNKAEAESVLDVSLVGPGYTNYGTVVRYDLFVEDPPSGGDDVPGSIIGTGTWTTGHFQWGMGWDVPGDPSPRGVTFGFKVDPLFLLQVLEVEEFVWNPVVRVDIQTAYMKKWDPTWAIPIVTTGPSLTTRANVPVAGDLVVNSIEDHPRKTGAVGAETGFFVGSEPEVTLRSAMQALNAGRDGPILFDIPGAGVPVIFVGSPLPPIFRPVIIDGSSQAAGQVLVRGNNLNAPGFDLQAGETEVKYLVIQGFTGPDGGAIKMSRLGANKVVGCKIGTDVTGEIAETLTKNGITIKDCGDNEVRDCIVSTQYYGVWIGGVEADRNNIHHNYFGVSPGGTQLSLGDGIDLDVGSDNRVADNVIASARGGGISAISGAAGGSNLTITGNRIGLIGADAKTGVEGRMGIGVFDTNGASGLRVQGNTVVGANVGIFVDAGCAGAVVSGNTVGITPGQNGAFPPGVGADHQVYGVLVSGAPGVAVRGNVVAGFRRNVAICGSNAVSVDPAQDLDGDGTPDGGPVAVTIVQPDVHFPWTGAAADGVVVENNTVGLNAGLTPPGPTLQSVGIVVYGLAVGTEVRNNTVAGHGSVDVWLNEGQDHVVSGNNVGTVTGTDLGSGGAVGVWVERARGVTVGEGNVISGHTNTFGLLVQGHDCTVRGNFIGTNRGGTLAWPNRYGVSVAGLDAFIPSGTVIEDNVIGGNSVTGVTVAKSEDAVTLRNNRIGVSANGLALANGTGVNVAAGNEVAMTGNTVAWNTVEGLHSVPGAALSVRRGAIYANGDGLRADGIAWSAEPFPVPVVKMRRTISPSGEAFVILAVSAVAGSTPVGLDFFANPAANQTQGRHWLFERTAVPGQPFTEVLRPAADSPLATMNNFTVTATVTGRTSSFSTHAIAESVVYPTLNFAPSLPGRIRLVWPQPVPAGLYYVAEAPTLAGPYTRSTSPVSPDGGNFSANFLLSQDDQYFRLEVDPAALLGP